MLSARLRIPSAACLLVAACLSGCGTRQPAAEPPSPIPPAELGGALNRISWGLSTSSWQQAGKQGYLRYLEQQLHPAPAVVPAEVQAQIAAMTIVQKPMAQLIAEMEQRRKDADAIADDTAKKTAQQAYQQELSRLAREAAARALLRALYSPNQLQEQMTWFWMNHFNVHQYKSNLRVMVGDYEDKAIRPHALGKFRDLLAATLHHPAMIRYLDNEQNAASHINENYARELMELHTLGVDGGYSQKDVQELARILTGVGLKQGSAFEFNPKRHDNGAKELLGQAIRARGAGEVDEALDRLARHPATARYISRKLVLYFVADEPRPALVDAMSAAFLKSGGDIAATLRVLFMSDEFRASLGHKFKDPMHYVVSAVRLAYDDKVILNTGPMLNWLNRMGEPLYGRQTPDGYPLTQSGWASPGQMSTRFEIAKAIGSGNAGLFKAEGPQPQEKAAFPQLSNALYFQALQQTLAPATLKVLDQATSPQEWNTFLLSSPELMNR